MRGKTDRPARGIRLAAVLAVAAALSLSACGRRGAADDEEGGGPTAPAVVEVTAARVTRAPISRIVTISGNLTALPNEDVRVSSLVAGRVAELRVAEGDRVSAGQVVARIDDAPLRDRQEQAEAAVAQAEASLGNARSAHERNETLFGRGIAARKDVEDARTQEAVAEASLRQARAELSLSRLQLSRAEVRSPIGGTIVKRFVSVGEQVDGTAAQPLVEVAERREVELFANVPASYLARFREGEPVELSSEAFSGRSFPGRVTAVSPAVDPATNLGLVRIRLANDDGLLRLGMYLTAQVPLETHAGALVVPARSIYRDQAGRAHVYRVEGETAVATPVELGIETPERDEILAGVGEGDSIVLTGGYGLGERSKVKVVGP